MLFTACYVWEYIISVTSQFYKVILKGVIRVEKPTIRVENQLSELKTNYQSYQSYQSYGATSENFSFLKKRVTDNQ